MNQSSETWSNSRYFGDKKKRVSNVWWSWVGTKFRRNTWNGGASQTNKNSSTKTWNLEPFKALICLTTKKKNWPHQHNLRSTKAWGTRETIFGLLSTVDKIHYAMNDANVPWRLSMAIRDSCPRVKKRTTYTKKNVTESKAGRQRSPKQDLVSMSSSDVGFLRGKRVTDDLRHICRQKHPKKIEGTKIVINFPPMHLSSKCHSH